MEIEAKIGRMRLQVPGRWQPLAAGKVMEGIPRLGPVLRSISPPAPWFQISGHWNCERIPVALSQEVCSNLLGQPQDTRTPFLSFCEDETRCRHTLESVTLIFSLCRSFLWNDGKTTHLEERFTMKRGRITLKVRDFYGRPLSRIILLHSIPRTICFGKNC